MKTCRRFICGLLAGCLMMTNQPVYAAGGDQLNSKAQTGTSLLEETEENVLLDVSENNTLETHFLGEYCENTFINIYGKMPEDCTLNVQALDITDENMAGIMEMAGCDIPDIIKAFDISIKTKDGGLYQPGDYGITLDMSMTGLLPDDKNEVSIYKIKEEKEPELIATKAENIPVTESAVYAAVSSTFPKDDIEGALPAPETNMDTEQAKIPADSSLEKKNEEPAARQHKKLTAHVNGYVITVEGLMPENATLKAERKYDISSAQEKIENKDYVIQALFDIKVYDGESLYQPMTDDTAFTVNIMPLVSDVPGQTDLALPENAQIYRIYDQEDLDDIKDITGETADEVTCLKTQVKSGSASFDTQHFTEFALGSSEGNGGTEKTKAYLKNGSAFNIVLKSFSYDDPDNDTQDNVIKTIKRVDTPFDDSGTNAALISRSDSEYPIYARLVGTEVQIYTPAELIATVDGSKMFKRLVGLREISVEGLDMSENIYFNSMFDSCWELTELDLSDWDVSNGTQFNHMFNYCTKLTTTGNIGNWNVSKSTTFTNMFASCEKLTSVGDLSGWRPANATDFSYMFSKCLILPGVGDLSGWDVSSGTNFEYMFSQCTQITGFGNISKWDMSKAKYLTRMFADCGNLPGTMDLSGWNTNSVININAMFLDCAHLTEVNVSGWKMENMQWCDFMFFNCYRLTKIDQSGWETPSMKQCNAMFYNCFALTDISEIKNWDMSNCTHIGDMFINCKSLTSLDISDWELPVVQHTGDIISGSGIKKIKTPKTILDTGSEIILSETTGQYWYPDDNEDLIADSDSFVTGFATGVADDSHTYIRSDIDGFVCPKATFAKGSLFAEKIKGLSDSFTDIVWLEGGVLDEAGENIENVADAMSMPILARKTGEVIELYTRAQGTYFNEDSSYMFADMTTLEHLGFLSEKIDTSEVTDFRYMFTGCLNIEELDLSGFDTSKAGENTVSMFTVSGNRMKKITAPGTMPKGQMGTQLPAPEGTAFYLDDETPALEADSEITYSEWITGVENKPHTYIRSDTDGFIPGRIAVLKKGEDFNVAIKKIANPSVEESQITTAYKDTKTLNIKWKTNGTLNESMSGVVNIATDEGYPVYARYDAGIYAVELYTEATRVYFNKSCSKMFQNLSAMRHLDFLSSRIDTSRTDFMPLMFAGDNQILDLDLSRFDTSKVTSMNSMFSGMNNLKALDVTGFDTSNVTNMGAMFNWCSSIEELDVSGFNTSKVTTMSSMFAGLKKVKSLDISSLDTSSVTEMSGMFSTCITLTELDVSTLDTSKCTNFSQMFKWEDNLTELDLSMLDMSQGTNFSEMFFESRAFKKIKAPAKLPEKDILLPEVEGTAWYIDDNRDNIADSETSYTKLITPVNGTVHTYVRDDSEGFWTSSVSIFAGGGEFNKAVKKLVDPAAQMTTIDSTIKHVVFVDTPFTSSTNVGKTTHMPIYARLSGDTVELYTQADTIATPATIGGMFSYLTALEEVDLSMLDTSRTEYLTGMFSNCYNLKRVNTTGWDTSKVKHFFMMFFCCTELEEVIGISDWDTSSGELYYYMFQECESIESLDLHKWNMKNATNLTEMFAYCLSLQTVDTTGWKFTDSDALYSEGIFAYCPKLTSADLSTWSRYGDKELTIGWWAFKGDTSITTLRLPSYPTIIKSCAFAGCDALTVIYGGENVTKITSSDAFQATIDFNCINKTIGMYAMATGKTQIAEDIINDIGYETLTYYLQNDQEFALGFYTALNTYGPYLYDKLADGTFGQAIDLTHKNSYDWPYNEVEGDSDYIGAWKYMRANSTQVMKWITDSYRANMLGDVSVARNIYTQLVGVETFETDVWFDFKWHDSFRTVVNYTFTLPASINALSDDPVTVTINKMIANEPMAVLVDNNVVLTNEKGDKKYFCLKESDDDIVSLKEISGQDNITYTPFTRTPGKHEGYEQYTLKLIEKEGSSVKAGVYTGNMTFNFRVNNYYYDYMESAAGF